MAERSKAHAWKVCIGHKPIVGSNPTLSATAGMAKFALVTIVAYGMNLITVLVAIRLVGLNEYFAQALGIVPYTLTAYLASRYLVFQERR